MADEPAFDRDVTQSPVSLSVNLGADTCGNPSTWCDSEPPAHCRFNTATISDTGVRSLAATFRYQPTRTETLTVVHYYRKDTVCHVAVASIGCPSARVTLTSEGLGHVGSQTLVHGDPFVVTAGTTYLLTGTMQNPAHCDHAEFGFAVTAWP